jgi:hypothetical protein
MLIHAGFGSAVLWLAGASQVQRRKKKSSSPPFPVGSEGEIYVNGDEVRKVPGLGKARIVTPKSLVLLFERNDEAGSESRRRTIQSYEDYMTAIRANDPDGVDVLIKEENAVRLDVGTKVRVIEAQVGIATVALLPCAGLGSRIVRITEGELKGKLVTIPTRNLRLPKARDEQPKEK